MTSGILLDTNAAIWLQEGFLDATAFDDIVRAGFAGTAYVSPVTAWEIGMLSQPKRAGRSMPDFFPSPQEWYAQLVGQPLLTQTALTADILLSASALPGDFHNDPADRMLVATARALGCAIMTSDSKILAYAKEGHVKAIRCRTMS